MERYEGISQTDSNIDKSSDTSVISKYVATMARLYSSTYVIAYLMDAFIDWELTNPLKWIIDIPTYSNQIRLIILFYLVFYTGMYFLFKTLFNSMVTNDK